jgi:thioredoxin reductase (NADPH)
MGKENKYDLVIIGAGPAGLTASVYASRFKINHLVVGQNLGGLAFEAHKIGNFPSEKEIKGMDLVNKMQEHVESLGTSILMDEVVDLVKDEEGNFEIVTQNDKHFYSKTVLIATGTEHRKLNLPGEKEFLGKGVSYCATCDAMFYRDKDVIVFGGGNSAHTASLYLADLANKVYQIYRGEKGKLSGERFWVDKLLSNDKIELVLNTQIKEIKGEDKLEKVILDKPYKGKNEIKVDGLFIEIGTTPRGELIEKLRLLVNDRGYIKVNADQKTSQSGIWAAGDITNSSNNFRQVITASSEGAIATESIFKFLQEEKGKEK